MKRHEIGEFINGADLFELHELGWNVEMTRDEKAPVL
jgi:hypothetical protein